MSQSAESSYLSVSQCIDNGIGRGHWQHVSRGEGDNMRDAHEVFVSHTLCAWGSPRALVLGISQPRHLLNVMRPPNRSACLYLMSCSPDSERYVEPDQHPQLPRRQSQNEWLGVGPQHPELGAAESPPPEASSHHICHYTPKCFLTVHRGERHVQLMPHLFPPPHAACKFSQSCHLHRGTRHVRPVNSHTRGPVYSVTVWRRGLAWRHHKDNNQSWEWGGGEQGGQQLQGGSRHSNSKRSTVPNPYQGIVRTFECGTSARPLSGQQACWFWQELFIKHCVVGKRKKEQVLPVKQSAKRQSKPKSRIQKES